MATDTYHMRKIVLLSAPTSLGLRPPEVSRVPGYSKAPEALGEAGYHRFFIEMRGMNAGATIPGRYSDKISAGRIRNEDEILKYSKRVQEQIKGILEGGDCSLLLGVGLAIKK